LNSDQNPRGACSDETMTAAAEERAAGATNEAVPGRIIDGRRESLLPGPVKAKPTEGTAGLAGINEDLGYSIG
jgi:hypothetical protein